MSDLMLKSSFLPEDHLITVVNPDGVNLAANDTGSDCSGILVFGETCYVRQGDLVEVIAEDLDAEECLLRYTKLPGGRNRYPGRPDCPTGTLFLMDKQEYVAMRGKWLEFKRALDPVMSRVLRLLADKV